MPRRSDPKIGLLLHLSTINGQKFDTRKAVKLLRISRSEMWALVGQLLKDGTITEPGGHGSQVYFVKEVPLFKAAEPSSRAKALAWAKKNREQWGVEPRKKRDKPTLETKVYHRHTEDSEAHLRAKLHDPDDLRKEAEEKKLDIEALVQMHVTPISSDPSIEAENR